MDFGSETGPKSPRLHPLCDCGPEIEFSGANSPVLGDSAPDLGLNSPELVFCNFGPETGPNSQFVIWRL